MSNKRIWFQLKILLFCSLLLPLQVFSQQDPQINVELIGGSVTNVMQGNDHPYLIKSIYPPLREAVDELYYLAPQSWVWLGREDSHALVADALQMLESAEDSGLLSVDYDLPILKAKWTFLLSKLDVSPSDLDLFDTALSISTIRYLADLQSGRIQPQSVNFGFPRSVNYDELVKLIVTAIQSNEVMQLTKWAEPDFVPYRKLKQALKHYRKLEREYLFPTFVFEKSLKEGDSDPQLEMLKRKLVAVGMMNEAGENNIHNLIYQGTFVDSVKQFQRRHGLNDDGVIGKKTLAALNAPFSMRVRQIELALERFRWLPRLNHDEPIIMVNIPAFQLWALESGDLQTYDSLNMKVIVGIAKKNKTPVFMAKLDYLDFRPYWNVPKKIAIEEIVPKILEDPDYLSQQNMELVNGFGRFVEPVKFTMDSLSMLQKGEIKVRQRPGRKNSLGLVKFIFPNKYAVYLHDTPAQSLFRSERRDFSHGCVRVAQPEALAEFVLRSGKKWGSDQIKRAMFKGKGRRVMVNDSSIAVLIYYSTAQVIDGEVHFFDDIYGYDTVLNQALYKQSFAAYANADNWIH